MTEQSDLREIEPPLQADAGEDEAGRNRREHEAGEHQGQEGNDVEQEQREPFTAQRQATAMLDHDVVGQAQVLAYADDFWVLAILFSLVPLFLPLMRRVHADPAAPKADDDRDGERVSPLPAPVE